MSPTKQSKDSQNWDQILDGAILNLLADIGKADRDGLLHVLKRERIRVDDDSLNRALARLSKAGRIEIDLDGASKSPKIELARPFIGWT